MATWFPAIREALTGRRRERGDLDARITSGPTGYVIPGQPYQQDWNVHKAVTEGYSWNPYVYRAVEFVASNGRARRMVLRREDPDEGPILKPEDLNREQQRFLSKMNRKANQWEIAQIWRHRLYAQYMLSARGVFIEAVRSRAGGIHSLYLLDPDRVEIVPGRRHRDDDPNGPGVITPIESFRVTTGTPGGRYWDHRPPWDPAAGPEEQPSGILWVRSPHPTILASGTSPMQAVQLSADLDRQARLYNWRFMQEDGRPGGVLAVKGPVTDEGKEILHARFTGSGNPGRTTVLEADEVKYTDTSGNPRDMQWSETMAQTAKEFCVAFGLPMSVITDSSGETFDNADSDYAKAWEHGMLPLLRLIDAQLDALTPGGLDDDTYLQHDVRDVWVLGRHQRAREDRAAADLERGVITIDEYREILGLEPWDVPATRVLWIPPQRLAINDGAPEHDGDEDAAAEAPLGGQGPAPDQPLGPNGLPLAPDEEPQPTPSGAGEDESRRALTPGPGSGGTRALAAADRAPTGAELTAGGEPERKSLEGEQRRGRHRWGTYLRR